VTLAHSTVIRGISDAGLYPLTADTTGSLTYGTKVDVVGIRQLTLTPELDQSEIDGDDVTIDSRAKLKKFSGKAKAAKIHLDVLSKLLGSTVTDSGSTPNQLATLTVAAADVIPKFKIAGQGSQVDTGLAAVTFTAYKCALTGGLELQLQTGDYLVFDFEFDAVFTTNTPSKILDIVFQETLVAL
jgi:hypothetical protein